MTVLNFPASPNQGDTYTVNNVLYTYEGVKWTANNPSNLSSEYVNITGDTMTGTLTVPALVSTGDITANKNITAASYNTSQLAGFRNQLINGNMLINQRGSVNTTTAGVSQVYTCDRWYVHSDNTYSWEQRNPSNANWNVGFTAAGFDTCLNVRNAQSSYQIRQAIELPVVGQPGQFVPGSTWNVSIYATDQPTVTVEFRTSVTGAAGDVVPVLTETLMPAVPGESMRYSYSFTVPSNITLVSTNNCLAVSFRNSSGTGAISVSGVQLEPGTVATPYEVIPIQTEIALCQRYYCTYTGTASSAPYAYIRRNDERYRGWNWSFPVQMRGVPVCTGNPSTASDELNLNACTDGLFIDFVTTAGAVGGSSRMVNLTADAEL